MTSEWILPPEEWAFFAKSNTDLIKELRHCWIPDEEIEIALMHEISRENFRRGGDKEGGYDLPKEKFEELIKKPFVSLRDDEKEILRGCSPVARGWYGQHGKNTIQVLTDYTEGPKVFYLEEYLVLFINWNSSDADLKNAFAKILKDKRPQNMPKKTRKGRRATERNYLKGLAAFRLLKTKAPPARLLEQVAIALNCSAGDKAFYTSVESMKDAAGKAEKRLVPFRLLSDKLSDNRKESASDPE